MHCRIDVGWDNPLETFFVQVWDERTNDEWAQYWAGTLTGEVPTLSRLIDLVRPYGEVPEEVLRGLKDDFKGRTPPTALQRLLRI